MKLKRIIGITSAFIGVTMSFAQNIAVVSENGETTTCQTLQDAIEKAPSGGIIYLPGGGFQINDKKITKKLSIIGIGYKANNNIDGCTIITGNLWFNENSSGSTVLGCYVTGDVNIGNDSTIVNDIVVKYCNLNSVKVNNNNCVRTVVNQNYIRSRSNLARGTTFMNNIANSVICECGKITNNIFNTSNSSFNTCYIAKNIFLNGQGIDSNSSSFANMAKSNVGNYPVNVGDLEWAELFVKYNNATISPASDFHFNEDYKSLYKEYGVYGGDGFIDQPPMPFIQAKSIPDETDASGNLTIKIRVNSGEQTANH